MAKTTNLNIRLEPKLKEQAELVLGQLGIPVSSAVNMFLKQVVMHRGIPFDVTLPTKKPVGVGSLTEEELKTELGKGYEDYMQGNTEAMGKALSEIHEEYRI